MNTRDKEGYYPQDWTRESLDKNGFYKLGNLVQVYGDPHRSKVGREPTEPPIYNADGYIVSKDGVSCFSKSEKQKTKNVEYTVTREFPNMPHDKYMKAFMENVLFPCVLQMIKEKEEKKAKTEENKC